MDVLSASAAPDNPGAPALRLSGFGVSFGRKVILAGLDADLPSDGVSVLMGPVKTGKSTLLRTLAGLNSSNSTFRCWGKAEMLGRPVDAGCMPSLVGQHAQALGGSAADALVHRLRQRGAFSPKTLRDLADQALTESGLTRHVKSLDTAMLDLPTPTQRAVGILSMALAENRLMMVDEPTYGLDERDAGWLVDWLGMLGRRRRLFVAMHHQQQARRLAQHIVLIGGGRVLVSASCADFFVHPPNAWAEQFVRTGSLYIASPDALPEDLSPDVEPPPPLSDAARAAIAAFEASTARPSTVRTVDGIKVDDAIGRAATPRTVADVAVSEPHVPQQAGAGDEQRSPVTPLDDVPSSALSCEIDVAGQTEEAARSRPVAAVSMPTAPPSRMPAVLPPVSTRGVEVAAMVGRAIMSEYRGPAGFHWIVPGRLAGCPEPGVTQRIDYDLDLLARVGVTYLVTLTEHDLDQNALGRSGLKNIHLPILDREAPTVAQAYMLVRRMQLLLDKGEVLAVHCKAGIGRTGTILGSWLVREGGLSAEEAISRLRAINRFYVQTSVQEDFLVAFEEDILKRL